MKIVECKNCHGQKQHYGKGLCKKCYDKFKYNNNKDKIKIRRKNYRLNHINEEKLYFKNYSLRFPLKDVWRDIKQRCYNKNNKLYSSYGAKGICLCDEWLDYKTFEKWCLDNDWKKGLQIDRIDNSGIYKPSNCQFLTIKTSIDCPKRQRNRVKE